MKVLAGVLCRRVESGIALGFARDPSYMLRIIYIYMSRGMKVVRWMAGKHELCAQRQYEGRPRARCHICIYPYVLSSLTYVSPCIVQDNLCAPV